MKENQLLGVCGLFCGACNHYRASCETALASYGKPSTN